MQANKKYTNERTCMLAKNVHLHVVRQISTKPQQIATTNIREKAVDFFDGTKRVVTLAPTIISLINAVKFLELQAPEDSLSLSDEKTTTISKLS